MSPIYVFECEACEKSLEKFFTLGQEQEVICPSCERPMEKVISPSHFVVKGYNANNLYGSSDKSRRK